MKKFTVTTDRLGEPRSIEVRVYDTAAQLRAACRRYDPKSDHTGTVGVFHSFALWRVDDDGTESRQPESGIMRLCAERGGGSVLVHELSHAAMALYGETLEASDLAEELIHGGNEVFAYLIQDLYYLVVGKLHEIGFYDDAS